MTIANLSEIRRIPRLGKIHLGIKATSDKGIEYPRAVDYFVVPEEVAKVHGEKPKELEILFPMENPEEFAPQFLRAYSRTQGLTCISDGIKGRRKIDLQTGALVASDTEIWEWKEWICNPQECPEYSSKHCRRVMNLLFLLPKVPGLGCWQIDTSSYYSIVNINSMVAMLKGILGRCSMIPLTLTLEPIEVSPPGLKKKKVHVLNIRQDIALSDLAQMAQLPPSRVLLPEVTEEMPEDLYLADEEMEKPLAIPPVEKPAEPEKPPQEKAKPTAKAKSPTEPKATPEMDPLDALRGKLIVEASNISSDYLQTVIKPHVKIQFGVGLDDLNKQQLTQALGWMIGAPAADEKLVFLEKMKGFGYDREAAMEKLKELTGKEQNRLRADLDRCLLLVAKEAHPQEESAVDKFLSETQSELFT